MTTVPTAVVRGLFLLVLGLHTLPPLASENQPRTEPESWGEPVDGVQLRLTRSRRSSSMSSDRFPPLDAQIRNRGRSGHLWRRGHHISQRRNRRRLVQPRLGRELLRQPHDNPCGRPHRPDPAAAGPPGPLRTRCHAGTNIQGSAGTTHHPREDRVRRPILGSDWQSPDRVDQQSDHRRHPSCQWSRQFRDRGLMVGAGFRGCALDRGLGGYFTPR